MFSKKNLRTKLSLLVFIMAICTFTMLQGFQLESERTVYVFVDGQNNSGCVVLITDNKARPPVTYPALKDEGHGYYSTTAIDPVPFEKRYTISVCQPAQGDVGIKPNTELIKGTDGMMKNTVKIYPGACAQ